MVRGRPLVLLPVDLGLLGHRHLPLFEKCTLRPVSSIFFLRAPDFAVVILARTGHERSICYHIIHEWLPRRLVFDRNHVFNAVRYFGSGHDVVFIFELKLILDHLSFLLFLRFFPWWFRDFGWKWLLAGLLDERTASKKINMISWCGQIRLALMETLSCWLLSLSKPVCQILGVFIFFQRLNCRTQNVSLM